MKYDNYEGSKTPNLWLSLSLLIVSGSSRRSVLVPTKMTGVFGQWCFTSGYHFPFTFSCEAGETTKLFTLTALDTGLKNRLQDRFLVLNKESRQVFSRPILGQEGKITF